MEDYQSSILRKDSNFNLGDFEKIITQNKGIEFMAIPEYRYILLQKRAVELENYTVSKDNFERLFLEEFTESSFKRLVKRMEYNGWSVRGIFQEVCKTGRRADYISTLKYNN